MREKVIGLVSLVLVVAAMWAVPPVKDVGYVLVEYDWDPRLHPLSENGAVAEWIRTSAWDIETMVQELQSAPLWNAYVLRRFPPLLNSRASELRNDFQVSLFEPPSRSKVSRFYLIRIELPPHSEALIPTLIDAWKDYCENRIRSHRRDVLKHLAGRIQTLEAELSNLRSNSNFEANSGQLLIAQQNLDTAMELREDIAHSSQMHPLDSLKFTIIKPPFAFSTRSLSDQPDWQTWDYGGAHEEIFRHFFHRGVLD